MAEHEHDALSRGPLVEAIPPAGPESDATSWGTDGPTGGGGPTDETPIPRTLGPYRVEAVLGEGGMGRVYAGFDTRLQRQVALKQIRDPKRGSEDARARFWREARALAALRHPGVVTVYDIGEAGDGSLYLAMELVTGRPVSRLLRAAWPVPVAVEVARQAAEALGAAHAAGIVHRDLKPSNLIIEESGVVRVIDFGLARRAEGAGESVTQTGAVMGTPTWMAPEQVSGAATSPRTDVFAVGILLYRLLSGVHPFTRESTSATALAIAAAVHAPLTVARADIPAGLVSVVERCLCLDPGDRYPDGRALAAALAEVARTLDIAVGPGAVAELALRPERFEPVPSTPGSEPSMVFPSPAGLPAPTLPGEPAPWPLWRPLSLLLAGGVVLAGAALAARAAGVVAWLMSPDQDAATIAAALPPRPVVAVLGLKAAAPELETEASVASEVLRVHLGLDPAEAVSVPLVTLLSSGAPSNLGIFPGDPSIRILSGMSRADSHVDLALEGTLERDGSDTLVRIVGHSIPGGEILFEREISAAGGRPVELGLALSREVSPLLGVSLPAPLPRTSQVADAWAALVRATYAEVDSDAGAARRHLDQALQRDPDFPLARAMLLPLLRAERRGDDLVATAQALVDDSQGLPPFQAAMSQVWLDYAQGRVQEAVRGLHATLDRWPYEAEAWELLLAILFQEPAVRDLAEAEKVATRYLAVAPRSEGAASKLVRSLAFRGRAAEARARLEAAGFPHDQPELFEIWGELALYEGRYDEAIAEFQKAIDRSVDSVYADHMLIATRLLSGDCPRAAVDALERIDRIESRGKDVNLDWTYSLANQALTCLRQWDAGRQLMDRWSAHSASGAAQSLLWRHRVALVAGAPPTDVARALQADLDRGAFTDEGAAEALMVLSRVVEDAQVADTWQRIAERRSVDGTLPMASRLNFLRAGQALEARALILRGDAAAARDKLASLVFPMSEARLEGDQVFRTTALCIHAEGLERLGDPAGAARIWEEIYGLGYPRLWDTDVWTLAAQRLGKLP